MQFSKAVLINIEDSHFDQKYLAELNGLVRTKVSLRRDDPGLMHELQNCDVLMVGFQVPVGHDIFEAAPNLKLMAT